MTGCVVVIGGTAGLGLEVARHYAGLGRDVVISGRNAARAETVAGGIGSTGSTGGTGGTGGSRGIVKGLAVDLAEPEAIAAGLAEVGPVAHLVIAAIERDENELNRFNVADAVRLTTLKLVGYAEVVHVLVDRFTDGASIVLFGGLAKDRPYTGSTTVSTVNGGITGLVNTMAVELAPIRVNAVHPGVVGDSPYWSSKPVQTLEAVRARVPTGRLVTMADIVDATVFLLENPSVNAVNLRVDGGTLLR